MLFDTLAYIGGGLLSFQLIPQIHKTYSQKNADNLSLPFMICNWTGLFCMGAYGIYNNDRPLYIPISISLVNTSILIGLKLYYTSFLF